MNSYCFPFSSIFVGDAGRFCGVAFVVMFGTGTAVSLSARLTFVVAVSTAYMTGVSRALVTSTAAGTSGTVSLFDELHTTLY